MKTVEWIGFAGACLSFACTARAQVQLPNNPECIVDLRTREGAALVQASWRYHDAELVEVEHRAPGPDMKASGEPIRTLDVSPKAGAKGFDDSAWEPVDPTGLEERRSTGRFAGGWYRLSLTVPPAIDGLATTGTTAVLELVVDDYAEVWVNGALPQVFSSPGGQLAQGWNTPSRVVLVRDAKPGQKIEVAVFAWNGPLSDPPANFVWIRSATLDFYKPEKWSLATPVECTIVRNDPAIDSIIPQGTVMERVASGFRFTEGPAWMPSRVGGAGAQPIDEGYLVFSDPDANTIYSCTIDGRVRVYRTKSGHTGTNIGEFHQPGSNGLSLDREGRLTICEHGNRRVTRLEKNGTITVIADSYQGKRLNSPNDLVYRSDGTLYFTDPPFGLPKVYDDPRKELAFEGVYCVQNGEVKLVSTDLRGPNGIAFSPDEKYLYVTNWDEKQKVIMRYDAAPDGTLSSGMVFFDMTGATGEEALDGLKVDRQGNLFCSGPGGVWVISAEGKHLGTIVGPELAANMAWGGEDGRTLYFAARTGIYRMALGVAGSRPW